MHPLAAYAPHELTPTGHLTLDAFLARLATLGPWHLEEMRYSRPGCFRIVTGDDIGPILAVAYSVATPEYPLAYRDRDGFVPLAGAVRRAIDMAEQDRSGHDPKLRDVLLRACGLAEMVPVREAAE